MTLRSWLVHLKNKLINSKGNGPYKEADLNAKNSFKKTTYTRLAWKIVQGDNLILLDLCRAKSRRGHFGTVQRFDPTCYDI